MDTILSREVRRGGSVLLKVFLGISILVAVRPQELGPHRQTAKKKHSKTIMYGDDLMKSL